MESYSRRVDPLAAEYFVGGKSLCMLLEVEELFCQAGLEIDCGAYDPSGSFSRQVTEKLQAFLHSESFPAGWSVCTRLPVTEQGYYVIILGRDE